MPLAANAPAAASFKKLMGAGTSLLRRGFRSSKCKTELKLATARIKLLRNRREAQIRQMRRDIAMLLESGQDATARIRVEHVIREQNILAANEVIELFCELVVVRLSIIAKHRDCPADLREGIASLIFAAPRCSEIPELQRIRHIFKQKYGKDFVAAATELRPNSGVNCLLIEKLSVRTPLGEAKLKIMKEIAQEYQVEWDITESKKELLKTPDENISGPKTFASAASMPVKSTISRKDDSCNQPEWSSFNDKSGSAHSQGSISAAQAAAELAEKAVAVAQAAAHLAGQAPCQTEHKRPIFSSTVSYCGKSSGEKDEYALRSSINSMGHLNSTLSNHSTTSNQHERALDDQDTRSMHMQHRRGTDCNAGMRESDIKFDDSDGLESDRDDSTMFSLPERALNDQDMSPTQMQDGRVDCNSKVRESGIKFDDSDGLESDGDDQAGKSHPPPNRPPPARHSSPPGVLDGHPHDQEGTRHPSHNRPPTSRHSSPHDVLDEGGAQHLDIYMLDPSPWVCPVKPNIGGVKLAPHYPPPLPGSDPNRTSADDPNVHKPDQKLWVHPKLPDYEKLAARFEALKLRRMS